MPETHSKTLQEKEYPDSKLQITPTSKTLQR
jgi:hypothetical protein